MSLQIWLPFTKDLINQGLSNVTVTNNGATFSSAGKLGGCYEFASGKRIQTTLPTSTNLKPKAISFACWMYVTSWNSSYDCFMSIADGLGWSQSRATLCRNNTASTLTWNIANGSNRAYVTTTSALPLNTWTHVAGTYDGTNLKIYINGVLNNTAASTLSINYAGTFNIGGWSGANYPFNGKLNDVRFYNHCLSSMEIKELSQGLVLHLPLNNNGLGNENLLINTNDLTLWNKESGVTINWDSNQQMYKMVVDKTNNTSRWGIYQNFTVTPNTTYTFSVEGLKGDHVTTMAVGTAESSIGWPANRYTFKTIKTKGVYTFTSGANDTVGRIYLNLQPTPDTGNKTAWFLHPKLELGDKATPWSPNPADEDYPDYGPGIPQNLLSGTPKSTASTAYLFTQLNLLENLQTGKTYTLQLWNVNVSHSAKTAEQTDVSVYWGGGNIPLFKWTGSTYFTDGHADYLSKTFTVTESQARGNGSANKWLDLYNSVPYVSGTLSASVGKWKLEESSTASDYTPAITDTAYKEDGYNNRAVFDQSGYCHNGANNNKIVYSSDSPKYNVSMFFDGTNRIFTSALPAETKTISVWVKTTKNKNTVQCICGDSASALCLFFYSGGLVTYFKGSTGGTGSRVTFGSEYKENDWNHLVVVKTGDTTRDVYCNGILLTPAANNYYSPATGLWIGQRNATGALPFYGYLSDFRAYVTALSEKDILSLYNNNAYIDSNNNIHGEIRA